MLPYLVESESEGDSHSTQTAMTLQYSNQQSEELRRTAHSDTLPYSAPNQTRVDSYCWYCGETGHVTKSCHHGKPIQCGLCNNWGHKQKHYY